MKFIFRTWILLLLIHPPLLMASSPGKTTLHGIIYDKSNHTTLPGVTIAIPDLKTGTVSKADGSYLIDELPSVKVLVQVSFIGYKTVLQTVDLSTTNTLDFELEPSVKEMNEVIVTGLSQATERSRNPTPITLISKNELVHTAGTNIIDALSAQPGIDQVSTGSGISKPVIRGLGFNRVLVVNDGIRQEGQQWGEEHGVEIDEYNVNRIEILKGPASLSYGSDAIAGVINMLGPPTPPSGSLGGSVLVNYQTNNGLLGYSGNMNGTQKAWTFDLRYSNKMAHAYKNSLDGYVYNSGFKENTISALVGLNKSWGYSHLSLSAYELTPGLTEGTRDSASGAFTRPVVINDTTIQEQIVSDKELKSYQVQVPYQNIHHYKAVLNNSFVVRNGSIKLLLGYQQNERKEFTDPFHPTDYGLFFKMGTINYDLRYVFPERHGLNMSTGINGMQQQSENKGIEFLVPAYSLFDVGGFFVVRKQVGRLDISGGIRYDHRSQTGEQLMLDSQGKPTTVSDSTTSIRFKAFDWNAGAISGSIGASYLVNEKLVIKANAARAYRSPNISELAANGEHEGTNRFELGNVNLKPETSLQEDLAVELNTEHVTFELNGFYNSISNFIFLQKLSAYNGGDSIVDPSNSKATFAYSQGNASLLGGEVLIDIHPHPMHWLHFENSFSFVESKLSGGSDSTTYLPFTPAPKLVSELKAELKIPGKIFKNSFVHLELENYLKQDKVYSAYGTETKTPGYTLLNFGIGTDVQRKEHTLFSIFISGNNLLDVAYQSHLSRLKYTDENYGNGRKGIFNMGRNFSFKVIVPIGSRTE